MLERLTGRTTRPWGKGRIRIGLLLAIGLTGALVGCAGLFRPKTEDGELASNESCFVCHINYADEKLAVRHLKKGITCRKCHGDSEDHCEDENHLTPPDVLYPRERIAPACMKCHAKQKLARKSEHKAVLAAPTTAKKICTDCHGKSHRLDKRTVRWDKKTRKLLPKKAAKEQGHDIDIELRPGPLPR